MDTSRKRPAEEEEQSTYKKHATERNNCSKFDEKFIIDTEASLLKSRDRTQCKFDCKDKQCYQTNETHISKFSHKHHCGDHDIAYFKKDTDTFLENTYNIYRCNNNDFSTAWHTKVGADRGEEKRQLKTFEFKQYDTFIFYMLANIALHLNEYEEKYDKEFLKNMLFAFETNDNTGLFPIKQYGSIRKIFTRYAQPERESGEIDYRLSNTTLRGIIESRSQNRSKNGGKKTKKRKHTKNKRSNNKRSNNKRSNNKRSNNKRSNNKRSNNKRSKNKQIKRK
jgi:hypothetical protein